MLLFEYKLLWIQALPLGQGFTARQGQPQGGRASSPKAAEGHWSVPGLKAECGCVLEAGHLYRCFICHKITREDCITWRLSSSLFFFILFE